MITPRFLPAAEAELLKEVAFFSNARDALGIKFEHAVEDAVKRAVANPNGGAPSSAGARNRPVKGFPFKMVIGRTIVKSSLSRLRTIEENPGIGKIGSGECKQRRGRIVRSRALRVKLILIDTDAGRASSVFAMSK